MSLARLDRNSNRSGCIVRSGRKQLERAALAKHLTVRVRVVQERSGQTGYMYGREIVNKHL